MKLRWFLTLLFLPGMAAADYLEVRRHVSLKAAPSSDAVVVRSLAPNTHLQLLEPGQTDGYYHAQVLPDGPQGWVYRTFVRRYPGEVPGAIPALEADIPALITAEAASFAARHLALGKPEAVYERIREGYALAQDARLKIPVWVQYELRREELDGPAERTDDFRPDPSIPPGSRAELSDYRGSGFDRGHLAPAGDMKRSEEVMSESFLLSNMAPQVGVGFNRHIWQSLESAVRGWVEERGTLTIITGPVFAVADSAVRYQVIGGNQVAVPTAFYKIVVDQTSAGNTQALAFVLPNENLTGRDLDEFLVAIDDIEAATGLDFLSALPDEEERTLESRRAERLW